MVQAKHGDTVKVHYTGKLEDGTVVFDSSENRGSLQFTIGDGFFNHYPMDRGKSLAKI